MHVINGAVLEQRNLWVDDCMRQYAGAGGYRFCGG